MKALPTLRQLQFLNALVRRRSFSRAAEDCLVSQSTLSSAIKELEGLFDQQLVDRSTRAFGLTPAGEEAATRADAIIAMAEDLMRAVETRGVLEGEFRLGVIPTIAPFLLPGATPRLRKAYPDLKLFLREDLTAKLVEFLNAGLLDAVLLATPYEVPGADIVEIGEDPFWLLTTPADPHATGRSLELTDLRGKSLLLLEDGHCLRDHALDACRLQREAVEAFGATSMFTLTEMVRSGLGATLAPEMAVKAGLAQTAGLAAVPFAPPAPSRRIALAARRGSGRRAEIDALAAVLKAERP